MKRSKRGRCSKLGHDHSTRGRLPAFKLSNDHLLEGVHTDIICRFIGSNRYYFLSNLVPVQNITMILKKVFTTLYKSLTFKSPKGGCYELSLYD